MARNRNLSPAQIEAATARREQFKALAKQISEMTDDQRATLASRMVGVVTVEGHVVSRANLCLLALQRENVTMVGGFRQWLNHGRCVRKGEKGLMIWVPIFKKADETAPAADSPEVRKGFICGTVFDVSQTVEVTQEAAVVS